MDYETLLIVANGVTYSFLAAGLVVRHRTKLPVTSDSSSLFMLLESTLKQRFPDIPAGFTWSEGLARAQELDIGVDWATVDAARERYEAFRYGGAPEDPPEPEVAKLVRSLR